MKKFNPERELYKLKYGKRNKIILVGLLMVFVSIISYSFALYQVRHSKRIIYTTVDDFKKNNHDIILSVFVEGEEREAFPGREEGVSYGTTRCEIEENGYTTVNWDEDAWGLSLFTKGPNKCDVYFVFKEEIEFVYKQDIDEYIIPKDGIYKLEVWGAQGGSSNGYAGGLGGYSFGNVELKKGEVLYVVVGGAGQVGGNYTAAGGYNGGGNGGLATISGGGGGGATHIATASGILSSLSENKESVLIVAGGGGGAGCSQAATQVSSCNVFGKGTGGISAVYSGGGGGGGYYGGCEGAYAPAYEPVAKAGTGGTGFVKENFIANSSNIQYSIQRGNGLAKISRVA